MPRRPGPPPKRDEARRRRNAPPIATTRAPAAPPRPAVDARVVDPSWHPIAADFYSAVTASPISFFYEPSDWAQLRLVVDAMSASLLRSPVKISAEMLRSVCQALDDLLCCEASRRSARLETPPAPAAPPPPVDGWHPRAVDWYSSLPESAQSAFYQPSDWAWAVYVAECISRHARLGIRMGGLMLACINRASVMLLTTEGARRAARLEAARVDSTEVDSEVAELMAKYAKDLE